MVQCACVPQAYNAVQFSRCPINHTNNTQTTTYMVYFQDRAASYPPQFKLKIFNMLATRECCGRTTRALSLLYTNRSSLRSSRASKCSSITKHKKMLMPTHKYLFHIYVYVYNIKFVYMSAHTNHYYDTCVCVWYAMVVREWFCELFAAKSRHMRAQHTKTNQPPTTQTESRKLSFPRSYIWSSSSSS